MAGDSIEQRESRLHRCDAGRLFASPGKKISRKGAKSAKSAHVLPNFFATFA
jgi:hypothetical protein